MDDEALPQAQFEIGEDDDMDNTDLLCSPSNDNDDNDDNDDEDMSDATLLEPQSRGSKIGVSLTIRVSQNA